MLSPAELALLESLLLQQRADPFNFPDEAVAQVNRLLAKQAQQPLPETLRQEFGIPPPRQVLRDPLTGRIVGPRIRGGGGRGYYIYRRLIELFSASASQRRYHVVLVQSLVPLVGRQLEQAFEQAIRELRNLLRYSGDLMYVSPEELGRVPPPGYVPFNPLGRYYDEFEDMEFDFDFEFDREYEYDYDNYPET